MNKIDTEFFFNEDTTEIGFTLKSNEPLTLQTALEAIEAVLKAAFPEEVKEVPNVIH